MTNSQTPEDFPFLAPKNVGPTNLPIQGEDFRIRYVQREAELPAQITRRAELRKLKSGETTETVPRERTGTQVSEEAKTPRKAEITASPEPESTKVLPQVTTTPVTGTQSSEMIVDLPQGQKFTLRGMSPGTIIEIASWSGNAGPDEAAIRMLFGATRDTNFEPYPSKVPDVQIQSGNDEVDLPNKKLRKDGAVSSLLSEEEETELTPEQIQLMKKSKLKRAFIRSGVLMACIGVLAGAIFGLRAANIVYLEHPTRGITTGLGGAESAIAVVSPGAALEVSATVIAEHEGEKVLAAVTAIEAGQTLLVTGFGQIVVPVEDVTGRLLFVIPFLGYVLGWFGG